MKKVENSWNEPYASVRVAPFAKVLLSAGFSVFLVLLSVIFQNRGGLGTEILGYLQTQGYIFFPAVSMGIFL
mgnify:CR=1 FL=1